MDTKVQYEKNVLLHEKSDFTINFTNLRDGLRSLTSV